MKKKRKEPALRYGHNKDGTRVLLAPINPNPPCKTVYFNGIPVLMGVVNCSEYQSKNPAPAQHGKS